MIRLSIPYWTPERLHYTYVLYWNCWTLIISFNCKKWKYVIFFQCWYSFLVLLSAQKFDQVWHISLISESIRGSLVPHIQFLSLLRSEYLSATLVISFQDSIKYFGPRIPSIYEVNPHCFEKPNNYLHHHIFFYRHYHLSLLECAMR